MTFCDTNAEIHMLRSVDSVSEEDGIYHAYPAEFLQQLNAGRLPSALLCLKVSSPVILLRNLDPGGGLCNGTRMVVLNVRRKVLQCRIISKDRRFRGKVVLIPRISYYLMQRHCLCHSRDFNSQSGWPLL